MVSGLFACRTVFQQCIERLDRPRTVITKLHLHNELVTRRHIGAGLDSARRAWFEVRLQVFLISGFECYPGRRLGNQHQPQSR